MKKKKLVVAMSGGVDSSVAALLLREQGYDLVGLFMRTGTHTEAPDHRRENKKGCCSALDAGDARRVADKLDIPFFALDFEEEFNQIIDYFADEYLRGRTPNPCVVCNNWLKFGQLWKFAVELGADGIATGHYARIVHTPTGPQLHRGLDEQKDQSYVLHGIKREILPHLHFPIGEFTKPEIRSKALAAGFSSVALKPDSVEICFVPTGNHIDVVRARRPEAVTAGVIRDQSGHILGEHDGIDRFTIGQRKGLRLGGGQKRFVLDILPESHEVVVGEEEALASPGLMAREVNWLIDLPSHQASLEVQAKIRYRHQPVPATVHLQQDEVKVLFHQPEPAVTPGQAVTFYLGTQVVGGGWIDRRLSSS